MTSNDYKVLASSIEQSVLALDIESFTDEEKRKVIGELSYIAYRMSGWCKQYNNFDHDKFIKACGL